MRRILCLVVCYLTAVGAHHHVTYGVCATSDNLDSCQRMTSAAATHGIRLRCVSVRDRMECLKKIHSNEADFGPFDPEDMFVASNLPDQRFSVIQEIRTKTDAGDDFRYEAVAVVKSNLQINNMQALRGKNSCHTGFGRTAGWKIPIARLEDLGVIVPQTDPDLTPRENELKAVSNFFNKACLVGTWAPDKGTDKRLKSTYQNLCALCDDPQTCSGSDRFSGYDGALRCLTEGSGDVAWTKVVAVNSFFGIPSGSAPAVNPDLYSYLCPDGSKRPLTSPPCSWAARPWSGYLTSDADHKELCDLRTQISMVRVLGEAKESDWLEKVLGLNMKSTVITNEEPASPGDYLANANYTSIISRPVGAPERQVRFCVVSDEELEKCRQLKSAAYSRLVRPHFDCVQEASTHDCMKTIRDGGADVITLDAGEVFIAERQYNLQPVLAEKYGDLQGLYYSVAVVKKNSTYQSLSDLRGARSCHTGYGRTAGWNIPLYTLLSKVLIDKDQCPYSKGVADFFSGSCVPGALTPENNPTEENPEKLCQICAGNLQDGNIGSGTPCSADPSEAFFGYTGAFRCLASGAGDVAFVKHTTVPQNTDGANNETWASALRSDDFELLCLTGGRATIQDYAKCNLAQVPPHQVVTSHSKTENELEEIRLALLGVSDTFQPGQQIFKLFGPFQGKKDLLFKDSATGLMNLQSESSTQSNYNRMLEDISTCQNQS